MTQTPAMRLTIPGTPRPQGSMRLMGTRNGKPLLRYPDTTVEHRNLVIGLVAEEWSGQPPLDGPVAVKSSFAFPRPKSHYGTGSNRGLLKPSAPQAHIKRPDSDKLARLVHDALTYAGVIRDDSQITPFRAEKSWTTGNGFTAIEIYSLETK